MLDRLRDFGEEVRYEPTAVVTRPAPRAGFELLWKVFGYGRGRAAQGRRRLTLASAVRVSTAQVALLAIFTAAAALPWTVLPLIALGACLLPYYLALVVQVAVRDGLGVAVLAPFAATGVHLAYAAGILSGLIRRLPARRGEVTVEKRTLGGSSAHRASFRSVDEALADQEPGVENAALSVIVPTYNEAANLPELLGRLKSALAGSDFEVIVVDDQSPDGTRGVAESVAAELAVPLRVLTREGPRSLSLAVIEGARAARHASVVVLDADLSHDPAQVRELSEAVLGGRCDLAVASRYVAVGDIDLWPLGRRLLSRTGTLLARLLTPVWVSDPLSGYFACRRDLLAGEVELRPRGYKILLEVLRSSSGTPCPRIPDALSRPRARPIETQAASEARVPGADPLTRTRASTKTIPVPFHRQGKEGVHMKRRIYAVLFVLGALAALASVIGIRKRPVVSAEAGKALLILYWEEDFQGRSLEVTGSLPDLPVQADANGNHFAWNDEVRSVVVAGGTWRLYQNGRANTKLDETPLEALDVRTKEKESGWSTLVSATSAGPLELRNGAAGGFYRDISSIELVSTENLPDWASPFAGGR